MFRIPEFILNWFKKPPLNEPEASKKLVFSLVPDSTRKDKSQFGLFYDLPLSLSGIIGPDINILELNSHWKQVINQDPDNLLSSSLLKLIHPKERGAAKEIFQKLLQSPLSVSFESRILCKDKPPEWLLWNAVSVPQERKIYFSCVPITEIRKELEKVRNSEAFYRELFENAPDIILHLDRLGFLRNVNPAAIKYTTYEMKDMIGKHFTQLPFIPLSSARVGSVEFAALMAHDENRPPFELIIDRKDGKPLILETNPRVIRRNNRYIGVMAVFRDVTERKDLEKNLKQARDEALESAKLKSEFLANMSHEIRTPMNAIVGMGELLKDSPLNKDQKHYVDTIVKSGESLLQIINDILDFSKMEAGKLEYREEALNLRELAEEATEMLATRAFEKNLELGLLMEKGVHEFVSSDSLRLKQVMVNLLGNAIKFTEKGEVVLAIHQKEDKGGSVKIRFEVIDTGIGISDKDKAKLFQSFSQIDSSATRKHGGTGLGLAISKRIIEGLNGTMGIESQKGKGSTFWFEIELKKSNEKSQLVINPEDHRDLRVLLVDDNKIFHEIMGYQMAPWGIKLDGVESGYKALDAMEKAQDEGKPYDLVFLDLRMPGLNGIETARKIREHPELGKTKLILVSSLLSPLQQDILSDAGINAQLTKPVSQSLLFDTMATVLKGEILNAVDSISPTESFHNATHSHFKILIVEDNPVNQELTTLQLKKLGFEAVIAANGLEAVEAIQKHPYSLILMDCQMPVMDGFTATQEIRKLEKGVRHTPIVGLTANAMEGDRRKCLNAGMDDYMSKPVKIEKLSKMIQKWDIPIDSSIQVNVQNAVGLENYPKLVEIYIKNSTELIADMKKFLAEKNMKELERIAHTFKGSSANMGARSLQILSDKVQLLAQEGKMEEIKTELDNIDQESARVFSTLKTDFEEAV